MDIGGTQKRQSVLRFKTLVVCGHLILQIRLPCHSDSWARRRVCPPQWPAPSSPASVCEEELWLDHPSYTVPWVRAWWRHQHDWAEMSPERPPVLWSPGAAPGPGLCCCLHRTPQPGHEYNTMDWFLPRAIWAFHKFCQMSRKIQKNYKSQKRTFLQLHTYILPQPRPLGNG